MNIFCLLGLHNWVQFEKWEPHIRAEIVTKVTFTNCCVNCGKEEKHTLQFDETAGEQIL